MDKQKALATIWRETHRDFKGTLDDGTRSIMVFRNGSTLVPLDQLTDAEIADRVKGYTPAGGPSNG
jgi:hypothetical protein